MLLPGNIIHTENFMWSELQDGFAQGTSPFNAAMKSHTP